MAHSHLSSGRSKARLCILYVSDERLKNGLQVGRWRQPFSALLIVPFISTKIIIFPQNGTKSKRSEHMKGRSAPPAHRHFRRAEGRVCISFSNVSGACSPLPRSPASSLALPSRTPLSFLHCHCRPCSPSSAILSPLFALRLSHMLGAFAFLVLPTTLFSL